MSGPVDARGIPIVEGSFVVYAVNSRDSGLNFGKVHKIRHSTYKTYDGRIRDDFGLTMEITDSHGNPKYRTVWDEAERKHVPTDKTLKSGNVGWYQSKFLVL